MSNYYDFTAIQNYTIGAGTIKELRRLTLGYGSRYLIMTDGRHIENSINESISNSLTHPAGQYKTVSDNLLGRATGLLNNLPAPDLDSMEMEYEFYPITGRVCSYQNAEIVSRKIKQYKPDVIVAAGGAKIMDIARASVHYVDPYHRPKLVLVPTLISSNACTNGMSVMYDEKTGQMVDFWSLPTMPECVIVDTDIIIKSPAETLSAGIGDQLASSIEALHTLQKIGADKTCDRICLAHHQTVIDVLRLYAVPAMEAIKQKTITPEFEWVCHAITRYTGPELAVASSFFAHILDEALHEFPSVARKMHGHIVGYGILPEMAAFGTPEKIYEYIDLFRKIGIPVSLSELGIPECTYQDLLKACTAASDKIMASRALFHWTPKDMADAVMEAEKLVNQYLN